MSEPKVVHKDGAVVVTWGEDEVSIVFTLQEADRLGHRLLEASYDASAFIRKQKEEAKFKAAAEVPVDRTAQTLTDGSPVTPDHREIIAEGMRAGQQKAYVVLSAEERNKGFVRPFRAAYKHLKCNSVTTMGQTLAETYARDPSFYTGTFCSGCRSHFPLDQFVWTEDGLQVGS